MIDGWLIRSVVHIWPDADQITHEQSPDCVCHPIEQQTRSDNGTKVWQYLHHSLDGRELSEPSA